MMPRAYTQSVLFSEIDNFNHMIEGVVRREMKKSEGSFFFQEIAVEILCGIYRMCLMNRNLIPDDNFSTSPKYTRGRLDGK